MGNFQNKVLIAKSNQKNSILKNLSGKIEISFLTTWQVESLWANLSSKNSKLMLHILNISSSENAPIINVYLDTVRHDKSKDNLLGKLALYGLKSYSTFKSHQKVIGMNEVWEVESVFKNILRDLDLSNNQFSIIFEPKEPISGLTITIGSVELYYHQ
jgi:hypothetical protein